MTDSTNDRRAIEALSARWLAAERRQDIPALLEIVTDDVVFLLPNGQAATGKPGVEGLFRYFFAGFESVHEASSREIQIAGDWAYAWGEETTTLTPRGGGAAVRMRGFGFSILRRGEDGQWRFARGINNLAPERPAAATTP